MSRSGSSVMGVMVLIAMACGLAIALVFEGTAERIADNRAERLSRAVGQVLPGAVDARGFAEQDDELHAVPIDQATFITGHDSAGRLIGVAVPASTMGYQDTIRLLLGYDPVGEVLTGFAVLESRETPGLGSKIGTDHGFLTSLAGLDVRLADGTLANPVALVPSGDRTAQWQVDGITGATVSSSAVVRAINQAAPVLADVRARLESLQTRAAEETGRG